MKKFLVLATVLSVFLIWMPLDLASAEQVKIGMIDIQRIMQESMAAKKARDTFLKDVEAKRAVLIAKQNEARALEEELKKEAKETSPSARKEKAEKLEREMKELGRLRSDLEEELKKRNLELTRKILQEVQKIVEEFLKKEKYTIVLEKKSVIAADGAIDITDKIIKLYDVLK